MTYFYSSPAVAEAQKMWGGAGFPVEKPKAIVVVYVHDTSTTSSHVATHVMRQFLSSSAVRQFVEQGR